MLQVGDRKESKWMRTQMLKEVLGQSIMMVARVTRHQLLGGTRFNLLHYILTMDKTVKSISITISSNQSTLMLPKTTRV